MNELEKRAARMKWDPPAPGTEERKEMPRSAFLSPSTRTFPYKVKIDDQWVISEPGLRSAISVANFRGNPMISSRASKILNDLLADEKASHGDNISEAKDLKHFGVPGMKWGVRRQRGPDGRIIPTSQEHKTSRIQAKTPMKQLSNAELRQYVERKNLEKQYASLSKKEISAGKKFAQAVIKETGKEVLKEVVREGLYTALNIRK